MIVLYFENENHITMKSFVIAGYHIIMKRLVIPGFYIHNLVIVQAGMVIPMRTCTVK